MQLCVCPSLLSRFIGELASHGGKREHALGHGFKSIVFQRSTGCTQPYDVDVLQSSPNIVNPQHPVSTGIILYAAHYLVIPAVHCS